MKQFCETYSNADEIISTLLREISWSMLKMTVLAKQ